MFIRVSFLTYTLSNFFIFAIKKKQTAEEAPASPEIHFEPIVSLPAVDLKSLEENEEELLML